MNSIVIEFWRVISSIHSDVGCSLHWAKTQTFARSHDNENAQILFCASRRNSTHSAHIVKQLFANMSYSRTPLRVRLNISCSCILGVALSCQSRWFRRIALSSANWFSTMSALLKDQENQTLRVRHAGGRVLCLLSFPNSEFVAHARVWSKFTPALAFYFSKK